MKALGLDIDGALALADKREAYRQLATLCPACYSKQVQLTDWFGDEPEWKCRHCKTKWKGV